MALTRKITGAVGLIFAAILAASYWNFIRISPVLQNGAMICFVATLFAATVVDWIIDKKIRT